MRVFNKGFNFNQDGPGNRLVYHLSGCNMRCLWCANPEGFSSSSGKQVTIEEIVRECISAKPMFFSNGGVTFTGGEATLYHAELLEVLKALKKEGIHTAIETNGSSPHLFEIQEHVDYLMMDFKHFDADAFAKFTGVGIDVLRKNFEELCSSGRQLHVRIPLINGVNADGGEEFAKYFSRFDTSNVTFELLPYHEYGKKKWKTEYAVKDGFVSREQIDTFKSIFLQNGLKIVNT